MIGLQLGADDGTVVPDPDHPLFTVSAPSDDNQLSLELLYQKIAVLETVEKLKDGALVWSKVAPYQYQSRTHDGGDVYELYVTKFAANGTVTLDVRKNASPYYFINSLMEPSLADLYAELSDRMDNPGAEKDKSFLRDLQDQAKIH